MEVENARSTGRRREQCWVSNLVNYRDNASEKFSRRDSIDRSISRYDAFIVESTETRTRYIIEQCAMLFLVPTLHQPALIFCRYRDSTAPARLFRLRESDSCLDRNCKWFANHILRNVMEFTIMTREIWFTSKFLFLLSECLFLLRLYLRGVNVLGGLPDGRVSLKNFVRFESYLTD